MRVAEAREGSVLTLTLDYPARRNALAMPAMHRSPHSDQQARHHDLVDVVIVAVAPIGRAHHAFLFKAEALVERDRARVVDFGEQFDAAHAVGLQSLDRVVEHDAGQTAPVMCRIERECRQHRDVSRAAGMMQHAIEADASVLVFVDEEVSAR